MFPYWALPVSLYCRLELPGWWRLLVWLKVMPPVHDPLWRDAPTRFLKLRPDGIRIQADLRDCVERCCYFLGRHPDIEPHLSIQALLRPGDRYIDVGAHIGMLALPAAARVGNAGEVLAFEPNPANLSRLERCVVLNGLQNFRLFDCALSDRAGEATFNFEPGVTTRGSLIPASADGRVGAIRVRTSRGDDLLRGLDARPTLLKIDVEGFEPAVISGCQDYIRSAQPAVITECFGPNLAQTGTSVAAFIETMRATGARGFMLRATGKRFRRQQLLLDPLERVSRSVFEETCEDLLWLFEGTAMWDRARPHMRD